MTQAEHEVLLRYPDAYHHYNTDTGKHKIYRRNGGIALSKSWDTESMAWHEAAGDLQRAEPVTTLHEGDDGR